MGFRFSEKSWANMAGVEGDLVRVAERALEISPIDFGVPALGGLRTAEEQHKLYTDGKSGCDGYGRLSNHQKGRALDVYAYVGGRASWNSNHLTTIAAAMLQAANELKVPVRWGGFWKSIVDMPHFELM